MVLGQINTYHFFAILLHERHLASGWVSNLYYLIIVLNKRYFLIINLLLYIKT